MNSIEDLDSFITLATMGHMGHAADTLGLTQPALSSRLRKLESRLGLRLFERHASGTRLSDAGMDLLEKAKQARAALQRLQEHTHAVARGDSIAVRVGMTLLSGVSQIPLLLREVERRSPRVKLVLHEAFSSPLEQLVADGALDLAFVHPPIEREDLTVRTLYTEPMVLTLPAKWTPPRAPDALAQWISEQRIYWVGARVGPDLHRRVAEWMRRTNLTPMASAEVSSYVIAQSFVAAGAGIALVPGSVARLHGAQVRALPPLHRPPDLPFAIVRRRRTKSALYDTICDAAAELMA